MPEEVISKPNRIIPGFQCPEQATIDEVAAASVQYLNQSVAAVVGGIVHLSGGKSGELATAHLNAIHLRHKINKIARAFYISVRPGCLATGYEYLAWRRKK
jgi:fructose-bisphosphate aldolase class 1